MRRLGVFLSLWLISQGADISFNLETAQGFIMIITVNLYNLIQSKDCYVFETRVAPGGFSITVAYEDHCAWFNPLYRDSVGYFDIGPLVVYLIKQINTQSADDKNFRNRWFPPYVYVRADESDTQYVGGNMAEYIWGYVDQRYSIFAFLCQPLEEKFLRDSRNRPELRESVGHSMGGNTRPDLWGPTRDGGRKREKCAKNKRAQGLTSLGALKQLNTNDGNQDARFPLLIQMSSEAVRFKHYSAIRGILARPPNQQNLASIALKDNWARMHFAAIVGKKQLGVN
uniref:rRNA N-glycosylase n=1 Tax=Celosia cristata TaxID=124768 RepID=Q599X2_9CARY|nr:antiviral-ribosome inactivating protein [Celosia cristata]